MAQSAEHSERDADQRGEQHGSDGELERRRQPSQKVIRNRPLAIDADPEGTPRDVPQLADELQRQRLIEAEALSELLHLRR